MTDYKAIKGKTILSVSSDLGAEGEGEIWFNTATSDFKTIIAAGSWASGGDMNTARRRGGGLGTQTAALVFGGYISAPSKLCEQYDGSTWTEVGDLNKERHSFATAGTTTAGLASLGGGPGDPAWALTEEWNGTSWTEVNDAPTATQKSGGCGTQTAQITMAGTTTNTNYVTESYEYDGTNWTDGGDVNTGRMELAAAGTLTAAVCFGGDTGSVSDVTETYDGSSWTTSPATLSVARQMPAGFGVQTAAVCAGGEIADESRSAVSDIFDGTSWAANTNLSTAKSAAAGVGTIAAGAVFGGFDTANSVVTEEWSFITTTGPGAQNIKIITD